MQGKGSDKIRLHAKQLIIDEDSVTVTTTELIPTDVKVMGHEYDKDREFYVIHLEQALKDGDNYTLDIEFTSILNDDLSGTAFYSCILSIWIHLIHFAMSDTIRYIGNIRNICIHPIHLNTSDI